MNINEKESYDLHRLIGTITLIKKDNQAKITFLFPISINDTRELRNYDLILTIRKIRVG